VNTERKKRFVWGCALGIVIVLILIGVAVVRGDYAAWRVGLSRSPFWAKVFKERDRIQLGARASELNMNRPSFQYLGQIAVQSDVTLDHSKIDVYIKYYQQLLNTFPRTPNAYYVLGVLQFYLGENQEAAYSLMKSAKLLPDFFWTQYNLGVIYFQRQDYAAAIESLQNALRVDYKTNLEIMGHSSIFTHIIASSKDMNARIEELKVSLREGYLDCLEMLIMSNMRIKNYEQMYHYARQKVTNQFDVQDLYYFGLAAYKLQRYEEATSFLQAYVHHQENHAEAYYYLGLSVRARGLVDDATKFLEKADLLKSQNVPFKMQEKEFLVKLF
jgi:tetratricopeptide (TPR) repeat protein